MHVPRHALYALANRRIVGNNSACRRANALCPTKHRNLQAPGEISLDGTWRPAIRTETDNFLGSG